MGSIWKLFLFLPFHPFLLSRLKPLIKYLPFVPFRDCLADNWPDQGYNNQIKSQERLSPLSNHIKKQNFESYSIEIKRRTKGAKGCNFLTSNEQFWMILKYLVSLELFQAILIYLRLTQVILGYLGLSQQSISGYSWLHTAFPSYPALSLFILVYLFLSRTIFGYLGLSRVIPG